MARNRKTEHDISTMKIFIYRVLPPYSLFLIFHPQLFKDVITNAIHQAPVVQRLDNAISFQQIVWFVLLTFIHWIVIYPVDRVIQPLSNWGQINHHSVDKC